MYFYKAEKFMKVCILYFFLVPHFDKEGKEEEN